MLCSDPPSPPVARQVCSLIRAQPTKPTHRRKPRKRARTRQHAILAIFGDARRQGGPHWQGRSTQVTRRATPVAQSVVHRPGLRLGAHVRDTLRRVNAPGIVAERKCARAASPVDASPLRRLVGCGAQKMANCCCVSQRHNSSSFFK